MIIKGYTESEFIRHFDKNAADRYSSELRLTECEKYITNGRILFKTDILNNFSEKGKKRITNRIIQKRVTTDMKNKIFNSVNKETNFTFTFISSIRIPIDNEANEICIFANNITKRLVYISMENIKLAIFAVGYPRKFDLSLTSVCGIPGRKNPKKLHSGNEDNVIISEYGETAESEILKAIPKLYLYSNIEHPSMKITKEAIRTMYRFVESWKTWCSADDSDDVHLPIDEIINATEIIDRSLLLRDSFVHEKEQSVKERKNTQISLIDAFR